MKLYLSLFFACLLLFSCSETPSEEKITYVDAGVDGHVHMFNTFHATKETIVEDGNPVTLITLAASVERQPDIVMGFTFYQGQLGLEACRSIKYVEGGKVYERFDDTFTIDVHESTSHRIRGLFSGNLKNHATGEIVAITGGSFDIFYNAITPYR